jgi:hypothetical protein
MIEWTRRRIAPPSKAIWLAAAASLAMLADVRPAGSQTPYELFRERTAMLATGDRCRLFDADVSAALASGAAQARTAALRTGIDESALARGAAQARDQVSTLACGAPIVQREAQRVKSAFSLYAALHKMSFPGEVSGWRADRTLPVRNASWMLAQDAFAGQDRVVFGVAGRQGAQAVTVTVSAIDGLQPYAARIILRDPMRSPQVYVPQGPAPLSARAPARGAARVIMAEARAEADQALLPTGASNASAFRFPTETMGVLQHLDPREAISVEFLYPSNRGDVIRTAFLEIGDFNAGLAFLKMGPR